jgi:hypothetical protein
MVSRFSLQSFMANPAIKGFPLQSGLVSNIRLLLNNFERCYFAEFRKDNAELQKVFLNKTSANFCGIILKIRNQILPMPQNTRINQDNAKNARNNQKF